MHEAVEIDADGKGFDPPDLRAHRDFAQVMLEPESSEDRTQKILGVVVNVEADQVRAQHPFQQGLTPTCRQVAKYFEARKRNVGSAFQGRPGCRSCLELVPY